MAENFPSTLKFSHLGVFLRVQKYKGDFEMQYVKMGNATVSRFTIGGNPFSGFSHQGTERDRDMLTYYSNEMKIDELKKAEALGINTNLARTDAHIMQVLREYKEQGGKLQWFAQTASEQGIDEAFENAAKGNAAGCYIHGGIMVNYYANGKLNLIPDSIKKIKDMGMSSGIASHRPEVFHWAEENLDCDFYMCCYYNPIYRNDDPKHRHGLDEKFKEEDREKMLATIAKLSKPVIHYKILAAGRNDPDDAFRIAVSAMRENDAVCVGIFGKDDPDMLEKDVKLLDKYLNLKQK
jgi:hypothetical protein